MNCPLALVWVEVESSFLKSFYFFYSWVVWWVFEHGNKVNLELDWVEADIGNPGDDFESPSDKYLYLSLSVV